MTRPPGTARVGAAVGVCVVVYLVSGPPHDGDLAAQTARAALFGRVGLVPWFAGWYAGLHVGGYSLTAPELMFWLRPAGLGVLTLLATGVLALLLLHAGRARRPVLGAVALTAFQLADLLSGRVTFAAGSVFVLAGVLAAETRHRRVAALLALLAALTSPVDALFAGVAAGTYLLADPRRRPDGWALGLGAGVGLALLVLPFPDPGVEPFSLVSMLPALASCLVVAAAPVGRRLRCAALLSAVGVLVAFAVATPVGTNANRLPMLLAVPALLAASRLPALLLVPLAAVLLPWPAHQLDNDLSASADPGAQAAFYAPLLARLRVEPTLSDHRLEVVEPRTHWQVVYLEPAATLARGWERQLDESLNPLFYRPGLTPAAYRAFLDRNAVALVALPRGTPIDFGSASEAALVRGGLAYLRVVWSDRDWVLYAVADPRAVATGAGGGGVTLTDTGLRLRTTRAGTVRLRLRYSPYLTVTGGTVARGPAGGTVLRLDRAGPHWLHAVWSVGGVWRAVS